MEFGQTLKRLRMDNDYTQKELATLIGVTEVTIGNWERGVKTPSLNALISLGTALHVSLDALTNFKFHIPKLEVENNNSNEKELLEKYQKLDSFGKRAVDSICEIEYTRVQSTDGRDKKSSPLAVVNLRQRKEPERYIPYYSSPSAAGIAVPLEGDDFEMILATEDVPNNADFAVRIQGDSMSPHIKDGDMVFVNKDEQITSGDVGIFCVDGAMYCKQYYKDKAGTLYLLSVNSDRKDANIILSEESGSFIDLCGKVILNEPIPLPDYFRP